MAAIFTIEMINFLVPFLPGFDALKDLAFSDSHTGHAKQVCHVLCPPKGVRRAKSTSLLYLPHGCPCALRRATNNGRPPKQKGPLKW